MLDAAKSDKKGFLNQQCNETITGKFAYTYDDGVSYYFSCDMEAQSNFEKVDRAFDKGRMTEITWTAYDSLGNAVRLSFNQTNFENLYLAHLNHIQENISKFRDDLMPQVMNATTVEELQSIQW